MGQLRTHGTPRERVKCAPRLAHPPSWTESGAAISKSGTDALTATNNDGTGGVDVVAMDDLIYGKPQPLSGCIFQDGVDCPVGGQ